MKPGFVLTIKFQYFTSKDQHYVPEEKQQQQSVRMHRLLLWQVLNEKTPESAQSVFVACCVCVF